LGIALNQAQVRELLLVHLRIIEKGSDTLRSLSHLESNGAHQGQCTNQSVRSLQSNSHLARRPCDSLRCGRWIALGLSFTSLFIGATNVQAAFTGTNQFTLSWTNPDSSVDGNKIERSVDGTNFTQIAQVAPTPESYTDSARQAATVYYYRMRSHNAAGDSGYSDVAVGVTPPALTIDSQTDYQTVADSSAVLTGTADGVNGIQNVTVNGLTALFDGTNWFLTVSLVTGTNTLTVIATDNSTNPKATTQIVHVIFRAYNSDTSPKKPKILKEPSVSNAMEQVGNIAVVVAGEPVAFTVQAENPSGTPLNYNWDFGDGQTGAGPEPLNTYTSTNCQGYAVSVVIDDGTDSTTGTVLVATACTLDIIKLQLNSRFASANADRLTMTVSIEPWTDFNPKGQTLALDVGNAQVSFLLDANGNSWSNYGRIKLHFNKRTRIWTLTARLRNGNWHNQWSSYGLVTGPLTASSMVTVPAVVVLGAEAFAATPQMLYVATTSKSGNATSVAR